MNLQFEMTDTFGGDANYSWVRRETITPDQLRANGIRNTNSNRAVVRAAKAWAGWTGRRCNVSGYGDMIDIRPRGAPLVLFVTWEEEQCA